MALTVFQCRVKSSDTENKREKMTRSSLEMDVLGEGSLPAQASVCCLSGRHELIIRHAEKFSLSLGKPFSFPVRRKRGALEA